MGLREILAAANNAGRAIHGVEVTYRRGEQTIEGLIARVGMTRDLQSIDGPLVTRVRIRDYLIAAADLILSGELTKPEKGDQIQEETEEGLVTYEVWPHGDDEEWRYSGPTHDELRIHTKQVPNPE